MVLTLDGNLEIGAHARSDLGYLISLMHLIGSRAVTNQNFFLKKDFQSYLRNMCLATMLYMYHAFWDNWRSHETT